MLISESLNAALNDQIRAELGNSHQYLAIASYFQEQNLNLIAKLFFKQADEEREHAMRFLKFVLDAGGKVVIGDVPAPRNEFRSAEDAAQLAYDSEVRTTEQIYGLMTKATSEQNYIAMNMLQWFVNEQLEEISSALNRLEVVRRAGPNLLMIEAYLAHGE